MERRLLKACLTSRDGWETTRPHVNLKAYSKEFSILLREVDKYYTRDKEASSVDVPVLKEQLSSTVDNEKHLQRFLELLESSVNMEVSAPNITALVISSKLHELQLELSTALANDDPPDKINSLMETYKQLAVATSLEDLADLGASEVMTEIDVDALEQARLQRGSLLELYPKSLNDKLDGGMERGDHVVLYGPTEIGKTANAITIASGFARQGAVGLYLINEDKTSRIARRFVYCLSSMSKPEVQNDPARAQELADRRGLKRIIVIGIAPGSLQQIDALAKKYKPDWMVVDQLRNITTGTRNNRVVQLEEAATGIRNILKARDIAGVSITQAGDSATNKVFLETGDVDFSNVGIPAQADLMIGVGANEEMLARNERGISLPKNKLSGEHARFVTRIIPQLSQVRDL